MHSLRASIVFIVIAVFAFLADNRRVQPPVTPQPEESAPAQVAMETPAPEQPAVEEVAEADDAPADEPTEVQQ